tara:strand:- start:271 stop:546 length:276 start_codon:yes stop_codon:yes gene_type:complete
MCRNIKPLFNFEPPATEEEIHEAALQFIRKVSGFRQPSAINQPAFDAAVESVAAITHHLLGQLETAAPPRDRATEETRRRAKAAKRFTQST